MSDSDSPTLLLQLRWLLWTVIIVLSAHATLTADWAAALSSAPTTNEVLGVLAPLASLACFVIVLFFDVRWFGNE